MVKISATIFDLELWIGSIVMVPSRFGANAPSRHADSLFRPPDAPPRGVGRERLRGANHIEHARDEAEQKKYNVPPGAIPSNDSISQPRPDPTSTPPTSSAREPEAPGVARCSPPISHQDLRKAARQARAPGLNLRRDAGVRGEGGFVGVRLVAFAVFRVPSLIVPHSRLAAIETEAAPVKPRGRH